MAALQKALIHRAREIIKDPANWTQTTAARDQLQRAVRPRSNDANMFCVFGALAKAAKEHELSELWLVDLFNSRTLSQLIHVNDSLSHSAVLAFLDQIEKEFG